MGVPIPLQPFAHLSLQRQGNALKGLLRRP
jgi:hypothetical protein